MATSYTDRIITTEWVDLTVATGALANAPMVAQNKSSSAIYIFFGGASAPKSEDGVVLQPGESVDGTSANVWARADAPIAPLYTALKDV